MSWRGQGMRPPELTGWYGQSIGGWLDGVIYSLMKDWIGARSGTLCRVHQTKYGARMARKHDRTLWRGKAYKRLPKSACKQRRGW